MSFLLVESGCGLRGNWRGNYRRSLSKDKSRDFDWNRNRAGGFSVTAAGRGPGSVSAVRGRAFVASIHGAGERRRTSRDRSGEAERSVGGGCNLTQSQRELFFGL